MTHRELSIHDPRLVAIREQVKDMFQQVPALRRAKLIQVGEHYTVEHRTDLGKWEVKYGEGHFGLYSDSEFAIEAIARADDEVEIPNDVSITKAALEDHLKLTGRFRCTPEELEELQQLTERAAKMQQYLAKAIAKGDRDLVHNAARNLRLTAGTIERKVKGIR